MRNISRLPGLLSDADMIGPLCWALDPQSGAWWPVEVLDPMSLPTGDWDGGQGCAGEEWTGFDTRQDTQGQCSEHSNALDHHAGRTLPPEALADLSSEQRVASLPSHAASAAMAQQVVRSFL